MNVAHKYTPLNVLHVDNVIGETSASYNEHILPNQEIHNLSILTYFPTNIVLSKDVSAYIGNSSFGLFLKNLRKLSRSFSLDILHLHSPQVGLITLLLSLIHI